MKLFLIPAFLVLLVSAHGQEAMSVVNVRAELEAMLETDQLHRRELIELEKKHGRDSAEVKAAWSKQSAIDVQNMRRLEEIIAQYGWPGSKQFGDKASNAAFLILQHSDLGYQKKYLPLVREAAGEGDMRASSLALLEDRVRLREGQKQIYGSQVRRNSDDEWEPLPLEDEENIDTRRASVGLGPILEYLQSFAARSGGKVNPKWRENSSSATPPLQPHAKDRPVSTDSPKSEPPSQEVMSVVKVRAELEAMLETDQLHRRELIELEKKHGRDSAEVKAAWSKQSAIDAQNIRRLEEIIAQYGWPGSKQFGDKAANTAFLILQHSDLSYQKKYLPSVREAASKGDMLASSLALLEDRVRLRDGQKQIYGSQVSRNSDDEWEPLPLEDEENVDTRRASVGLGPILEYLQRFAARSGGKVNPKWEKYGSKANPPVQHKAGSRPDSTDSPASETSSAPASPVAN